MAFTIEFSPAAEREFRKLAREIQLRLRLRIDSLEGNPQPAGAKKLKGGDDYALECPCQKAGSDVYPLCILKRE